MSSWLVQSPWIAYIFHARLADKSLLSEAHSIIRLHSSQNHKEERVSWHRLPGAPHMLYLHRCAWLHNSLAQKKARLSNQKQNTGDLLLKHPCIVALGISVFLLVVEFLVGFEEVLDPRKSFVRFIIWMQTLVWWERIGAAIKHLELEKARKLYNAPFIMQEADTGWYRRGYHGLCLFLFSWVTHKDDVVSPQ